MSVFDRISYLIKDGLRSSLFSSAYKSVLVSPIFNKLFYNLDSLSSPISLLPFTDKFLKSYLHSVSISSSPFYF